MLMNSRVLDLFVWALATLGAGFLLHRHWRRQAIASATQWATQNALVVPDWSRVELWKEGNRASVEFVVANSSAQRMDVKLRLRIGLFSPWQVDEVVYCLPQGVTEDDTASFVR